MRTLSKKNTRYILEKIWAQKKKKKKKKKPKAASNLGQIPLQLTMI